MLPSHGTFEGALQGLVSFLAGTVYATGYRDLAIH